MKDITFNYEGADFIAFVDSNGEPWFSATEVCKILKHTNTSQAVKNNCEEKGISTAYTLTSGGRQRIIIIDEPNLYRLIFKSKLKNAVEFQKWVFEVVLPAIRKTGKYLIPEKIIEESKKNRKYITSEWKRHGIEKPSEYAMLTIQEYKALNFEEGKRKPDFTKEELLTLSALESMESLRLFYNQEKLGYSGCEESLKKTARAIDIITAKSKAKYIK